MPAYHGISGSATYGSGTTQQVLCIRSWTFDDGVDSGDSSDMCGEGFGDLEAGLRRGTWTMVANVDSVNPIHIEPGDILTNLKFNQGGNPTTGPTIGWVIDKALVLTSRGGADIAALQSFEMTGGTKGSFAYVTSE